jgi:hypothetical protein
MANRLEMTMPVEAAVETPGFPAPAVGACMVVAAIVDRFSGGRRRLRLLGDGGEGHRAHDSGMGYAASAGKRGKADQGCCEGHSHLRHHNDYLPYLLVGEIIFGRDASSHNKAIVTMFRMVAEVFARIEVAPKIKLSEEL